MPNRCSPSKWRSRMSLFVPRCGYDRTCKTAPSGPPNMSRYLLHDHCSVFVSTESGGARDMCATKQRYRATIDSQRES